MVAPSVGFVALAVACAIGASAGVGLAIGYQLGRARSLRWEDVLVASARVIKRREADPDRPTVKDYAYVGGADDVVAEVQRMGYGPDLPNPDDEAEDALEVSD